MAFEDEWAAQGFLTCDECGEPALWHPEHGVMHVTEKHPTGIRPSEDPSGHRPTIERFRAEQMHTCRRPCRACAREAAQAATGNVAPV